MAKDSIFFIVSFAISAICVIYFIYREIRYFIEKSAKKLCKDILKNKIQEYNSEITKKTKEQENYLKNKVSKARENLLLREQEIYRLKCNFDLEIKNKIKQQEYNLKRKVSKINEYIALKKDELFKIKYNNELEIKNEIKEKEEYLRNKSSNINENIEIRKNELFKIKYDTEIEQNKLEDKKKKFENDICKFKELCEFQEKLFTEKTIGFPWIASAYAEYIKEEGYYIALCLEEKSRPALKAAEEVKKYSKLAAEAKKEAFIFKHILEYYETIFPWLTDFRDAPDEAIRQESCKVIQEEEDPARRFLSGGEWEKLSTAEKFQRALDRYWKRKKTNWQIGRDYERYTGYRYESKGWEVTYVGAIKGLEDMGRDLIAKKDGVIHIVQCKYWAADKVIHEKHLFQLFGTCIVYAIENSLVNRPQGIFITSCRLSETAKTVADILKIKVVENLKFQAYPCIKCNISKTGEKIYHLPFDQQYDKIKMTGHKDKFYASTIAEAEAAGFRRAYRWHGNKS